MARIKALFFDYDGTLLDTHGSVVKSFTKVFDEFEYEISKTDILGLMGERVEIFFKKLGINPGHIDAMAKRFTQHKKSHAKLSPCCSLDPLRTLSKKYTLVIVSNTETEIITKSLKQLGFDSLFAQVYGADTFATKENKLRSLFKTYKIRSGEAMYIGDRFSDVRAAKHAGCISVAINNHCSWSDLETIRKERPDFIIQNFKELERLVRVIERNS